MCEAEGDDCETARRIASMFLPGADSLSLRRVGGGLSGAAVFSCQADEQVFALKRWPAGTSAVRVDEVHEVMIESKRSCSLVPELVRSPLGTTRLGWESYHYELASWMPGESARPDGDFQATLAAVQAGAEAIARFHDSVRRWGIACAPAPAILRRLGRIEQVRAELPLALSRCDQLSGTLRTAADWLRCQGDGSLNAAAGSLGRWAGEMVPTQIVLRDGHREHLLCAAGQASGLVDFDAVARDSTATDLARWVSDFLEPGVDRQAIWDAAQTGYRRMLAISPCELELAGAISDASGVILLANWVIWIALKQRNFSGCYDLVDRRVGELMRRMVPDRIVSAR